MSGNDEKDKLVVRSQAGTGDIFDEVLEQRMIRRSFLKAAAGAAALAVAGASADIAEASSAAAPRFTKIAPQPKTIDKETPHRGVSTTTILPAIQT